MEQAQRSAGFWRSVRELPSRTPLRVKLITALLALVAIALAVISVAGIAILKSNLLEPYDAGLEGSITRVINTNISQYLQQGQATRQPGGVAVEWIPSGGKVHQVIQPYSDMPNQTFSGLPGSGANSGTISPPAISADPAWVSSHLNHPFTVAAQSGGIKWRVLMQTVPLSNGSSGTAVLAIDVSNVYSTIGKLATIDLLISLVVIALLGILGVTVVRRSLRPLTDIEKTAGAIAAGDLSRRVPERDPRTEVGRLGRSLNTMLSQIESAFHAQSSSEAAAKRSEERMRQFVGDASHELRTPLTAIRGFAEYYRQRGGIALPRSAASAAAQATAGEVVRGEAIEGQVVPSGSPVRAGQLAPADMDRIMRRVEQEAARMGVLVEDMLLLARLDQQRPLEARPVDLLTLAADAVHDARVVAPARSIHLTVGSGRALLVIGDEVRLRQVIGNLMSNALTHTPDGTAIDVLVRSGNLDEAPAAAAAPGAESPAPGARAAESPGPEAGGTTAVPAAIADETDRGQAWDAEHIPPPPSAPAEASATAAAATSAPAPAPASMTAPAQSQPAAVLEVTDHGPGLTKEQAEHVFERFYRADAARTTGGTGLGLAIVAALVAAHGGATWVRTKPGEGATFCIALPLSAEAVQGGDEDFDGDADEIENETTAQGAHGNGAGLAPEAPGDGHDGSDLDGGGHTGWVGAHSAGRGPGTENSGQPG